MKIFELVEFRGKIVCDITLRELHNRVGECIPPDEGPLFSFYDTINEIVTYFPDHADYENVRLILIFRGDDSHFPYSFLLTCSHFEHSSTHEITLLSYFMQEIQRHTRGHNCYLNLLHDHAEKLIIETFELNKDIIEELLKIGKSSN